MGLITWGSPEWKRSLAEIQKEQEPVFRGHGGLAEMKGDPLLRRLERDPRYTAFLKK